MEKITSVINSNISFLYMIGKTIHITEEQARWIDKSSINLSKFVRTLLDESKSNSQ